MITQTMKSEHALAIAQALLKEGKVAQALKTLNIAFLQSPSDSVITLELARLCLRINKSADAIKVLEKSVQSGNQSAEVLYMLASILYLNAHTEQALLICKTLTRLHPSFHQVYNLLGNILYKKDQTEEAESAFLKSIELNPANMDSRNNLAWLQRSTGNKEAAIKNFKEVISKDPTPTEALFGLSMLQAEKDLLDIIDSQLNSTQLSNKQHSELLFAKAKILDQEGKHDQAFAHYQKANKAWREHRGFNIEKERKLFETLKKITPADTVTPPRKVEENEIIPVFIVGLPRSSTTLIEQILVSHSNVSSAGEISHFPQIIFPLLAELQRNQNNDQLIQKIATSYLKRLPKSSAGQRYIIDKLPQNFLFLGLIKRCFPQAKIIHCSRNPIDHAVSLFKHHFPMSNHDYAYSLEDIQTYYALYRDLMAHWNEHNADHYYNSVYEELIEDFEQHVRSLLNYCELEFEHECLEYYNTKRSIRTASSEQVRSKLSRASLEQWKPYEPYLKDLITNLQSYS